MPAKKSNRSKTGHKMHSAKKLGKVKPLTLTASTLNMADLTTVTDNSSATLSTTPTATISSNTGTSTGSGMKGYDIATNKPT